MVALLCTAAVCSVSPLMPSTIWNNDNIIIFFVWLVLLNNNVSAKKTQYVNSDSAFCMTRIIAGAASTTICAICALRILPECLWAIALIPILPLAIQAPLFTKRIGESTNNAKIGFSLRSVTPFLAASACAQLIFTAPILLAGVISPVQEFADLRMLMIISQPGLMILAAHAQGSQAEIYRVDKVGYTKVLREFIWKSLAISIGYSMLVGALLTTASRYSTVTDTLHLKNLIHTACNHWPVTLLLSFLPFFIVPAAIALRLDRRPMMLAACYALSGSVFIITLMIGTYLGNLIQAYAISAALAYSIFFLVFALAHEVNITRQNPQGHTKHEQ
jgi:hypothetical protein